MVKPIVLIILAVFLVTLVIDRLRKKKQQERAAYEEIQKRSLAADESGPTQTGKFRVQQMLQKTEPKLHEEKSQIDSALDDDAPLPDPFDGGKTKK